jgi:hypothetical protein
MNEPYKMSREELLGFHQSLCGEALELMKKKNHDYAGKGGQEPFANFTRTEAMGITTTEKGMLVRMTDKMSRLSSFTESGTFAVSDEKLLDTILDMINYSVLFYCYMQEKQIKREQGKPMFLVEDPNNPIRIEPTK